MFGFSKNKKNKPRFFCETCDAEVPRDAKSCPKCGSNFSSVRCPSCDFIGEEARFRNGCPACGYSNKREAPVSQAPGKALPPMRKAGALPFWVYILTAAVFTAVLAALFLVVFN